MSNPFEEIQSQLNEFKTSIQNIHQLLLTEKVTEAESWMDLDDLVKYDPEKRKKPTFYSYIHNNIIPYHKRGKKLIFLKSEIDNWLKLGRKKTNYEIQKGVDSYCSNKKN